MISGRRLRTGDLAGSLLGLAVLAGSIVAPVTAATAGAATRTATRTAGRQSKSPIGYYNEVSSNGGTGQIHIETNNVFETNYGDTGAWVETKTSLALVVFTSQDGDTDCVYLGKWSSNGINTAKKQGPTSCNGAADTWYALRSSGPTSTPAVGRRDLRAPTVGRRAVSRAVKGAGSYTLDFSGGASGTLQLSANGTAEVGDLVGLKDGYWVGLSKAVAFETTRGGDTCVWVGLLDKAGIGTSAKPGTWYCLDEPSLHSWWATKTK